MTIASSFAAVHNARTNRARFEFEKSQIEARNLSDADLTAQIQDGMNAKSINKQRAEVTQDRLQGLDIMKRMRTIAQTPDGATRSAMVKGIVDEQKARGVIITPMIQDMLKSGKTENLMPMLNHWSAQISASGEGSKKILDTITNVDKSFAAIENAQFGARNPEAAKQQNIKMMDTQIQGMGEAITQLSVHNRPQAANALQKQQEALIKERARLTGEDKPSFSLSPGQQRFSGQNELVAENVREQAPLVQIDQGGVAQDVATDEFAKFLSKDLATQRKDVIGAADSIRSANNAVELINSGIITGFGAEFLTSAGNALKRIGINFAEDAVANTQAYMANQAKQVAQIIKAFGAGTGLSDADREYAEKAAAGKITMTENALKRIIQINATANSNVINQFNKDVSGFDRSRLPFDPDVPLPDFRGFDLGPTPVFPKTEDEVKNLPSGTSFIWEGIERVKR